MVASLFCAGKQTKSRNIFTGGQSVAVKSIDLRVKMYSTNREETGEGTSGQVYCQDKWPCSQWYL